jgi:Gas vesicle synthesis protein GvpO
MAERESRSQSSRRTNGSRRNKLNAKQAIQNVRNDLPPLLGRPVESVLGVQKDEDEGWRVMVQIVELERIPRTTDVLGAYEVNLDDDGELVGYRRRRRYTRGQPDED